MARIFKKIWNQRAYVLRGIFCWLVGFGYLLGDYHGDFDFRYTMRPPQAVDSKIILVMTEPSDWGAGQTPAARQEVVDPTDGLFWRADGWKQLLTQILNAKPAAVGVSFFFGAVAMSERSDDNQSFRDVFHDPRVVWAARVDSEGRALLPAMGRPYGMNTGVVDFTADADGIVRRLSSQLVHIPPFGLRLVAHATGHEPELPYGFSLPINFRGDRGRFPHIRYKDLIEGKIPASLLKDKIVIIGSESLSNHQILTPVGFMTRAELLATTVDNIRNGRWINQLSVEIYAFYLLAVLLLSIWIILAYPQSVSIIFLLGVAVIISGVSASVFDSFYFWIPIAAPLLQMAVAFIVFLSFQLSINERKAWKLEREQKYFMELERLKGNFLSLFSHDLKTPIAKIQAIVDRVMTDTQNPTLMDDMRSLKKSSQDLHRYIHSILQLSRVEARELKIRKEATDINELVEKAVEQIQPLASEKKIRIEKNLEPLFSLELDPVLVGEVVLNLIDNAVKYTPTGGRIRVDSWEEDDSVFVTVDDTGPGIVPDELSKIWEKFYRVSKQSSDAKGSGLGLYLVRYFIELHGGKVFVKNNSTTGMNIGFALPIASEEGMFGHGEA